MSSKNERIKKRILIPVSIVLFFLMGTAVLSIYWFQQKYIYKHVRASLREVQAMLELEVKRDAELLSSQIDFLKKDENLLNAWLAKDRDALLRHAMPLFEQMRARYRITHFYVIGPDSVCFLRVHDPARYGDTIDRLTMEQAEREEKEAYGAELGQLGTFALRMVRPWRVDGRLVGYLELGKEIEHITQRLKNVVDAELYCIISKAYLDRDLWQKGLKMIRYAGEWDLFPHFVVIDRTTRDLPPQLHDYFTRLSSCDEEEHLSSSIRVSLGQRQFLGGFIALMDAGGRDVGDIIVLKDITMEVALLQRLLIILIAGGIIVSVLLFTFLYFFIDRIERSIITSHSDLRFEIKERRKAEQALQNAYQKLKETQRQLIQSSKMAAMGQLAAGISHEISQPLTGIKGFAQAALMDFEKNSPHRRDLDEIVKQADRIDSIIKNVRTFARKSEFRMEKVDVNESIENTLMLLTEQMRVHNIRVNKSLARDLPKIEGNLNQLQQVFTSLIVNARDAIDVLKRPEGGKLTIKSSLSKDKKNTEIIFKDTGCGISKENRGHVFNPFFTTKNPAGGIGLGLSVAYRIIEDHKGVIAIEESKEDVGTTFKITLPVAG